MIRRIAGKGKVAVRDPFSTEHLQNDLGGRAVRGGALTMGAQGLRLAVQVASTIVLARLLPPSDFGLVAMVMALTGLAALFSDLGLSMATVQRRNITPAQVNALFWINVAIGVVIAAVVVAFAPLIAWFYTEPRLVEITFALAFPFLLGGAAAQHKALIQRQMRFRALVTIDLAALIGGICAAIALAVAGAGYWALVANSIATSILSLALVWIFSGWRPGLPARAGGVRSMIAFGANLTGFNLVNYFARNLDNILIGWWWGASALGLYSRAYRLLTLPIQQINAPMAQVMVPGLSRIQSDGERWRQGYCRAITAMMLATAPISTFSFVFADPIIPLLLGSQWAGAVPIFRNLAIAGVAQSLFNSMGWIYISRGRSDRMFKWGIFGSTIFSLSFIAGLPYGPSGVALAYSIAVLGLAWPCVAYACYGTPLRQSDVFKASATPVFAAIMAAFCAYLVTLLTHQRTDFEYFGLFAGAVVFTAVYIMLVLSQPGTRDIVKHVADRIYRGRVIGA